MCFGSQSEKIRKKEYIPSRQGSFLFSNRSSTKRRRGGGSGRDGVMSGQQAKKKKLERSLSRLYRICITHYTLLNLSCCPVVPKINPITEENNAEMCLTSDSLSLDEPRLP